MAIRLRKLNGSWVALCAAESQSKAGDVYLHDGHHHALTVKFDQDFESEHAYLQSKTSPMDEVKAVCIFRPSDVADHFDIPVQKATNWLRKNAKYIESAMCEGGHETMIVLGMEDGLHLKEEDNDCLDTKIL